MIINSNILPCANKEIRQNNEARVSGVECWSIATDSHDTRAGKWTQQSLSAKATLHCTDLEPCQVPTASTTTIVDNAVHVKSPFTFHAVKPLFTFSRVGWENHTPSHLWNVHSHQWISIWISPDLFFFFQSFKYSVFHIIFRNRPLPLPTYKYNVIQQSHYFIDKSLIHSPFTQKKKKLWANPLLLHMHLQHHDRQ